MLGPSAGGSSNHPNDVAFVPVVTVPAPTVLVVDDDPGTLVGFRLVLRGAGFEVLTAESAEDALRSAHRCSPDLIIADLRLPERSGLDLLRTLREEQNGVPFVIVTAFGSVALAVDAIKAGASDFVEKPLIGDEVIAVATRALSVAASNERAQPLPAPQSNPPVRPAARRWAAATIATIDEKTDPRTLAAWGRLAGASPSTLKSWCRAVDASAKSSLVFARLLRAIYLASRDRSRPEDWLDVVDAKTLERYFASAGMIFGTVSTEDALNRFLDSQLLVENRFAVVEVRTMLEERGILSRRRPGSR